MITSPALILAAPIVLGALATWISWRLGLPSILLLLLVGLVCGPALGILTPDQQFGNLLEPFVALAVAVIMFEGGLTLRLRDLREAGPAIRNLVLIGIPVTAGLSWIAARYLLGFSEPLALVVSALLVVTGPTVIGPLLLQIRPPNQLAHTVRWEGVLNDGLGALLAVLVLGAITAEAGQTATGTAFAYLFFVGTAAVIGVLAAGTMVAATRWFLIPDFLENTCALALVICTYGIADMVQNESGLLAVTITGAVLANQPWVPVRRLEAFKEDLRVVLIGTLFIVLAAGLSWEDMRSLGAGAAWFVAALILIVRPVAVLLSTLGTDLTWKERTFVAWMAPRGIVAAAASAVFAPQLLANGVSDAGRLEAVVFAVIISTVLVYGLTALPLARKLGLATPSPKGVIILGAHGWARKMGHAMQQMGYEVQFVDSNWESVSAARMEGFRAQFGSVLSRRVLDSLDLHGVGKLFALTPNDEINSLACLHFRDLLGRKNVFQLPPEGLVDGRPKNAIDELQGRFLFASHATYGFFAALFGSGAEVKVTKLSDEFSFQDLEERYGPALLPLFSSNGSDEQQVGTMVHPIDVGAGNTVAVVGFHPETKTATTAEAAPRLAAS